VEGSAEGGPLEGVPCRVPLSVSHGGGAWRGPVRGALQWIPWRVSPGGSPLEGFLFGVPRRGDAALPAYFSSHL
jgi:hypothetical protein